MISLILFTQLIVFNSGGISSYGILLMIVAFIQFQFWYCSNPTHIYEYLRQYYINHKSLSHTIIQFCSFYSNYLSLPSVIIQPQIPNEDRPFHIMPIEFQSSEHGEHMFLRDPLNESNNVAKSSYHITEIKKSFNELVQTENFDFLKVK